MHLPAVSIIVVTYNSSQYIVDCLAALQAQSFQNFEILVYDNASQDQTPHLVQAHFPAVTLLRGEKNIGFAAANNRAAARASGDYLAFLNPDTRVDAHWLPLLLETLVSSPVIGAVTPRILFADRPDRVNTLGNQIHLSGITYCQQFNLPATSGPAHPVSAISGAAFLISRLLFAELGGFTERLFMYYEDTDLSIRLRCRGLTCTAVPDAIVYHAYIPSFSPQKIYYLERNRYLSLFSLLNWQILLLMLPSLLLMEGVAWGYAILQGREAVAAKGRAWSSILKSWRWIWQRRQSNSCARSDQLLSIFSARLQAQYVAGGKQGLIHLVEISSWLLGALPLSLAKRLLR